MENEDGVKTDGGNTEDTNDIEEKEEIKNRTKRDIFEYDNGHYTFVQYYNRLGFYFAIDHENKNDHKLETLISQVKDSFQKKIDKVQNAKIENDKYFEGLIDNSNNDLSEAVANRIDNSKKIQQLRDEHKEITGELDKLLKDIHVKYQTLVTNREKQTKDIFADRLIDIDAELSGIIKNYEVLSNAKREEGKTLYNENKYIFEARIERLNKIKSQIESVFEVLKQKILNFNDSGLTAGSVIFITIAGYIGLVACGWFYSIYVINRPEINNTTYLSFILNRLITSLEQLMQQGNVMLNFAFLVLGLLALLSLVSLISWFSTFIIEHRYKKSIGGNGFFVSPEEINIGFYHKISSQSSFAIWLETMPKIFIAGLVFILIAASGVYSSDLSITGNLGTRTSPDLERLLLTLSGEFIGAAIALVVTSLCLLYISFIVDKRLQKNAKEGKLSPFTNHWEISILFLFFVAILVGILSLEIIPTAVISISCFLILVFFTAFSLAYGIKFRSMILDAGKLENELKKISQEIEYNSWSLPIEQDLIFNSNLHKRIHQSLANLFEIVRFKNLSVLELITNRVVSRKQPIHVSSIRSTSFWSKFARLYNRLVGREQESDIELPIPEPTKIEHAHFPEESFVISDLRGEWKRKNRKLNKIDENIDKIEEKIFEDEKSLESKCTELKVKIDSLRKDRMQKSEEYENKIQKILERLNMAELASREGYDLGLWYRGYNLGEGNN